MRFVNSHALASSSGGICFRQTGSATYEAPHSRRLRALSNTGSLQSGYSR